MDWLHIKNWDRFQHYSKRNPPWIKLHVEILTSADWVMLADASKLLAIVCIIIGARHKGRIPHDPDYIKRVAYLDKRPDLTPLINCGFLETLQADASTLQATATPETETEAYSKETKKKESLEIPSFIDGDTWLDFVKHRGGSKFTRLMAIRIIKQLTEWNDKGHDVKKVLNISIMNGWKAVFEPDNKGSNENGKSDTDAELARFLDRRTN